MRRLRFFYRRQRYVVLLICFGFFIFFSQALCAETCHGRVIKVSDGDTLTVLGAGNRHFKIRLAEIDAPESKQPYGKHAKQELSNMVFAKSVTVDVQTIDRYGRFVGHVCVDGRDVGAEMLNLGAAWVYVKYAKDERLYALEKQARKQRLGLWKLPEAERIPPWEWRRIPVSKYNPR